MIQRIKKRYWLLPFVWVFFFLALHSMVGDSPTMDEQNHLARGLALLRTGDPRLSLEHPPLINVLSALPLLALPDVRLPTDDWSWEAVDGWYRFAELLVWDYNHDVSRMFFLARLPIVFLTLALALAGYWVGNEWWEAPAGHLTFLLLLFDPNLLAHGRYTTTDLGGTATIFLATAFLWRLWAGRGHWLAVVVGLGLAFGSKLSAVGFLPIWLVLAVAWPAPGRVQRLFQLFTAALAALLLVWAIFAFQWAPFQFQRPELTPLNQFSGPMPTFWAGLERILLWSSDGRPSFLLGQSSADGFLAYFPVAFLVKTPLPALLLILLASGLLLGDKATRQRGLMIWLPAGLYFLLALQSSLNIGYRHLLPMLPFLYLLVGGLGRRWANHWFVRSLFLAFLLATLSIHPHYLSYFNWLAGGPQNGYNVLLDSNIDWGQDLLRLRDWLAENEVEQVKLAWFGTADPAYYAIDYQPLPGLPRHFDLWWQEPLPFNPTNPEPGLYAISVSNLWELPRVADKVVFAWFRDRQPTARIGYSIFIYRVP